MPQALLLNDYKNTMKQVLVLLCPIWQWLLDLHPDLASVDWMGADAGANRREPGQEGSFEILIDRALLRYLCLCHFLSNRINLIICLI